jgi:hypothetical protein
MGYEVDSSDGEDSSSGDQVYGPEVATDGGDADAGDAYSEDADGGDSQQNTVRGRFTNGGPDQKVSISDATTGVGRFSGFLPNQGNTGWLPFKADIYFGSATITTDSGTITQPVGPDEDITIS